MKNKTSIITAAFLFIVLTSCSQTNYVKIRMEIPKKPVIDLTSYKDIFVTNFLENEEVKEFNINQEILDYFSSELKKHLKKDVKTTDISVKNEEDFKNPDTWKNINAEEEKAAFFTGSVKYSEETRKSLRKQEKRRFDDPFPEESRIETRSFYSLELQIYLIDTQTGKIIYDRNFKENKSYENPNQTPQFAFFDLILEVRDKLLEDIQGYDRLKERYLLAK